MRPSLAPHCSASLLPMPPPPTPHRHTPAQAPFPWALVPGDAQPSASHWVLLMPFSWDEAGGPCPSKGPQMKSLHLQGRRAVPAPQSHRMLGTHTAPALGHIPSTSQERKLRLDQDSWLVPGSLSSLGSAHREQGSPICPSPQVSVPSGVASSLLLKTNTSG